MFNAGPNLAQKSTHQQIRVAQDLAGMIDILVAHPANIEVNYSKHVPDMRVALEQNKVFVYKQDQTLPQAQSAGYSLPQGYSATGQYKGEGQLCLKKEQTKITAGGCT